MDIAGLAVKIDSREVKKGKLELVEYSKEAQAVEKAITRTEKAVKEAEKAIKDINKEAAEYAKKTRKVQKENKKTKNSFDAMKAAIAATGIVVVYQYAQMGMAAIKFASDLEEADSKFKTVFRGQVSEAENMADVLTKSYGQSRREAREYLAGMQDLLVPMGMGRIAAAELSNEMVKLATDLGSFNNRRTADVMRDMQGALVGEFEAFKKYGVILNKAKVDQKALEMGLAKTKEELLGTHTALAAYQLMLEGSTDAVGDFKRTSDGYANTTKILNAAWEDFAATLGEKVLPAATATKNILAGILKTTTQTIAEETPIEKARKDIEELEKTLRSMREGAGTVRGAQILDESFYLGEGASATKDPLDVVADRLEKAQENLLKLQREADEKRRNDREKMLALQVEDEKKAAEQAAKSRAKIEAKAAARELKLAKKRAERKAEQEKRTRAQTLESAEIEYFRFTQGQLALDKNLVLNQAELWVKAGFDRVKATGWATAQIEKLEKEAAERNKKNMESTVDFYESMGSAIESSLTDIFTDALRGELDSFEDYFSSFTDSLASMWGQMAARMVMGQGLPAGVSLGGFGAAGVGIAASSMIASSIERQNAEDDERMRQLSAEYVQANQLTGSILGDISAKSDSTNTALDNILETNIAGLGISREMLAALNFVATNNERLAANIGRRTGGITTSGFQGTREGVTGGFLDDVINANVQFFTRGLDDILGTKLGASIGSLFGSTKRSLIDSGIKVYSQNMADILEGTFQGATFETIQTTKRRLWRRRSSTSTTTGALSGDISGGLADMFIGVTDALSLGADTFGIAMEDMYTSLTIAEQQISLKGKTAEEAAEIIGNFVSQTADSWAQTMLTGTGLLEDYQRASEGAFETYVRLTNETEFLVSSLDMMGMSINAVGVSLVDISQSTIEAAGGIESLQESMSSFYSNFFSDEEKHANLLGHMTEAFSEMNMIMPATREAFKNLVTSLDLTTESGQDQFAALMELSSTADQFYDSIEKSSKAIESASKAFENARRSIAAEISGDQGYQATRAELMNALVAARGGNLTQAVEVSGRLGALSGGPTTARTEIEFRREQLQTLAALKELEMLTGDQLTTDELMVSELETVNETLASIDNTLATGAEFAAPIPINTINGNVIIDNTDIVKSVQALEEKVTQIGVQSISYEKKLYDIIDQWNGQGYVPTQEVV